MVSNTGDFQRVAENALIRRDLNCLERKKTPHRMTECERDRHDLVTLLGMVRAELRGVERERDTLLGVAAEWAVRAALRDA